MKYSTYKEFVNDWLGKLDDIDRSEGVQCVDAFKRFLYEQTGTFVATINGWADGFWIYRNSQPLIYNNFDFITTVGDA